MLLKSGLLMRSCSWLWFLLCCMFCVWLGGGWFEGGFWWCIGVVLVCWFFWSFGWMNRDCLGSWLYWLLLLVLVGCGNGFWCIYWFCVLCWYVYIVLFVVEILGVVCGVVWLSWVFLYRLGFVVFLWWCFYGGCGWFVWVGCWLCLFGVWLMWIRCCFVVLFVIVMMVWNGCWFIWFYWIIGWKMRSWVEYKLVVCGCGLVFIGWCLFVVWVLWVFVDICLGLGWLFLDWWFLWC